MEELDVPQAVPQQKKQELQRQLFIYQELQRQLLSTEQVDKHLSFLHDLQEPEQTLQQKLDLLGLKCPIPVLKLAKKITQINVGDVLEVMVDDPKADNDIEELVKSNDGAGTDRDYDKIMEKVSF